MSKDSGEEKKGSKKQNIWKSIKGFGDNLQKFHEENKVEMTKFFKDVKTRSKETRDSAKTAFKDFGKKIKQTAGNAYMEVLNSEKENGLLNKITQKNLKIREDIRSMVDPEEQAYFNVFKALVEQNRTGVTDPILNERADLKDKIMENSGYYDHLEKNYNEFLGKQAEQTEKYATYAQEKENEKETGKKSEFIKKLGFQEKYKMEQEYKNFLKEKEENPSKTFVPEKPLEFKPKNLIDRTRDNIKEEKNSLKELKGEVKKAISDKDKEKSREASSEAFIKNNEVFLDKVRSSLREDSKHGLTNSHRQSSFDKTMTKYYKGEMKASEALKKIDELAKKQYKENKFIVEKYRDKIATTDKVDSMAEGKKKNQILQALNNDNNSLTKLMNERKRIIFEGKLNKAEALNALNDYKDNINSRISGLNKADGRIKLDASNAKHALDNLTANRAKSTLHDRIASTDKKLDNLREQKKNDGISNIEGKISQDKTNLKGAELIARNESGRIINSGLNNAIQGSKGIDVDNNLDRKQAKKVKDKLQSHRSKSTRSTKIAFDNVIENNRESLKKAFSESKISRNNLQDKFDAIIESKSSGAKKIKKFEELAKKQLADIEKKMNDPKNRGNSVKMKEYGERAATLLNALQGVRDSVQEVKTEKAKLINKMRNIRDGVGNDSQVTTNQPIASPKSEALEEAKRQFNERNNKVKDDTPKVETAAETTPPPLPERPARATAETTPPPIPSRANRAALPKVEAEKEAKPLDEAATKLNDYINNNKDKINSIVTDPKLKEQLNNMVKDLPNKTGKESVEQFRKILNEQSAKYSAGIEGKMNSSNMSLANAGGVDKINKMQNIKQMNGELDNLGKAEQQFKTNITFMGHRENNPLGTHKPDSAMKSVDPKFTLKNNKQNQRE